ncbi:hypothetical protein AB0J83_40045 [Actinoplanes sp. NPDC049596]|uniref:hypothetical protein n=1 Tax=unclassified Actinoplanes TaxID=2626549 RepID=UPI003413C233
MTGFDRLQPGAESSSVIRTALIALATGGLTFLLTNVLDQPQATCIMLSILIGGIALLMRFLNDFEKRLAAVERLEKESTAEMKRLIRDAFLDINEATALYRQIEDSAMRSEVLTRMVRTSARISPGSPRLVYEFVEAKINETSDFVKHLAENGTVIYYGEDRDWLLSLTEHAVESIDAISLSAVDHDFWRSDTGQRYVEAQCRAARDGRRVRRIFVFEPGAEDDDGLRRVCENQLAMGIDVRLLDRTLAPDHLKVRDVIVFDDVLAYETMLILVESRLAQTAETRLVLADDRVKEYTHLFRELWEVSRELTPQTAQRKT